MKVNIDLIYRHLQQGNLNLVMQYMDRTMRAASMPSTDISPLMNELGNISSTYLYMVKYAVEGMPDPHRQQLRNQLADRLYLLAYRLQALQERQNMDPGWLYSISQTSVKDLDLQQEINSYLNLVRRASLAETDANISSTLLRRADATLTNIFLKIWTSYPVNKDEYDVLERMLQDDEVPDALRMLCISALTLLLTKNYDSRALLLLLHTYAQTENVAVAANAVTGAVISLLAHHEIAIHDESVQNMLGSLQSQPGFMRTVREVIHNLAATRETENIGRTINEEILPEIQRTRTDLVSGLQEQLKNGDIEGLEENPEWERLLNSSGIGDKLKQLSDWQMQGADVMMTAFGQLKRSQFFRSPDNWFAPFDPRRLPQYETLGESLNKMLPMLQMDGTMCDSDKYSFFLAIAQMPEAQRSILLSQFGAQFEQLREEAETSLHTSLSKEIDKAICRTVRNLFRFFRQFDRRKEFDDPFALPFCLAALAAIPGLPTDEKLLHTLAEFFMTRGFYADAAVIYKALTRAEDRQDMEQCLQKLGYCLQQSGNYEEALQIYSRAEMINGDSKWLLRQIAFCHKRIGNYKEAAKYYELLMLRDPDNTKAILNLANCLLETGEYEKALKLYYKVDYLEPDKPRTLRPMAWCLLMMGRNDESLTKYEKIMTMSPSSADKLAYGHLLLKMGRIRDAVQMYVRSIRADEDSYSRFLAAYRNDARLLKTTGIDPELLALMPEAVYFEIKGLL